MKFDLESNITHSPDASRRKDDAKRSDPTERRHSDTETSDDRKHRRRKRRGKERESDRGDQDLTHDPHERRAGNDRDEDSDTTVDLPPRFDERGNPKPGKEDLAAQINDLLSGKGGAGGLFKTIAGEFLGGQGGGVDESDGESKSNRRRHRR